MRTLFFLLLALLSPAAYSAPDVSVVRVPGGGIQPVAEVAANGDVHLVYFRGDPAHGDLFHAVRRKGSAEFGEPVKINSTDGSSIAIGTIRGVQIALGRENHVHVAWMGSSKATPGGDHKRTPMLYARSTDGGKSFAPERNVITDAFGLDGGGAIAADDSGHVEVFWHAGKQGAGETARKIWVTRSDDDGKTFAPEVAAWDEKTGVCGCCGMTAGAAAGRTWAMYRSATERVNRDIYLLRSDAKGAKFEGRKLDSWELEACPMSAMSLSFAGDSAAAAWESKGAVAYTIADSKIGGRVERGDQVRKFPDVAISPDGHVLLAWIDGGGWKKQGQVAWQLFDPEGKALGKPTVAATSAVWTKPAAVYDGESFLIIH